MCFVYLNCHSYYSLLEGASSVDGLLEAAGEKGVEAMAITDVNSLYGALEFYSLAGERGVRPVIGTEIRWRGTRATFLARNTAGYREICRLITSRHLDTAFSLAEAVAGSSDNAIVLSPCAGLLREVANLNLPQNVYAAIEHPLESSPLTEFARTHNLALVAAPPVWYARKEDAAVHRILAAIRTGTTLSSLPTGAAAPPDACILPRHEVLRRYARFPGAVDRAGEIALSCKLDPVFDGYHLPSFPLPDGETPFSRLWRLCSEGALRRYGQVTVEVLDRLRYELEIIERCGFASYFLAVNDIASHARDRGIPTIGRGSCANSIVSYLLGFTHVDPIKHDLYFERFLNPERGSPPDIDLDFSWKRRDEVIEYVYGRFGSDRVAMIATVNRLGARGAIREVGKAMGVDPKLLSHFTENLPHTRVREIRETVQALPECRSLPVGREPLRTILNLALKLDGFPRHLGVHAGGIVIAPSPLTDFLPLERAAKGVVVTQYDMRGVEKMGLVKIDLLGQRSLAVVEDVAGEVKKRYGKKIDPGDHDLFTKDMKTIDLVRSGRTIGCFYIESPAMRLLLKKLAVDTFEDLVAASSVIRPGVASSGMMKEYIRRHCGGKASYPHPDMEQLLSGTHGVMIYQEDVMKVAHRIAGLSLSEADLLRRAMSGKARSTEEMDTLKRRFISSAISRGVAPPAARELWRQIRSFAGYAFCKAHSASFAQLSFQTAYLKAHHPELFMAAVLSNGGGFYTTGAYIEEARRMGIEILPPDINRSEIPCKAGKGWIRVGMMGIRNLSTASMKRIVRERRRRGFYTSLAEFRYRTEAGKRETESLILCGAFDAFELNRPELLWRLAEVFRRDTRTKKTTVEYFRFLRSHHRLHSPLSLVPRIPDYSEEEKLKLEAEVLGFTASSHPLALYGRRAEGLIEAREIARHRNMEVELVGWLVCTKLARTARGAYMRFLTFEDTSDTFEAVMFPPAYRRYGRLLNGPGPYVVRGRVNEERGAFTVNVKSLKSMDQA